MTHDSRTHDSSTHDSAAHDSKAHLSDEALDDVLIGLGSSAAAAHLAVCPACRARVENFHADMQAFNETSLAWSERQANTMPAVAAGGSRRSTAPRLPIASLGLALAAMLLLAIAAPLWRHLHSSPGEAAAPAVSVDGDSQAQIAQDNELLRQVNAALNSDAVAPLNPYPYAQRPRPQPKAGRKRGTE